MQQSVDQLSPVAAPPISRVKACPAGHLASINRKVEGCKEISR